MKTMIKVMSLLMLFVFASFTLSEGKKEVEIQTNAQCGACKGRIEGKLNYVKGIQFAELNLDNKVVTVKFNPKKITELEIKNLISDIGYDADEVKADPVAQSELPKCCQPGGHE